MPFPERIGGAEIHGEHDVFNDRQGRQQLEELKDDADGLTAPYGAPALVKGIYSCARNDDLSCAG
jgi:hypothetical protein